MAEILMHRPREWVIQINSVANADTSLRVATPLLNTKRGYESARGDASAEFYIPQILFFGPYHIKDSCSAGSRKSAVEAYKDNSAAILSQILRNCGKSFDYVVEMMEQKLPEIGRFYNWVIDGEYTKNFAFRMAVDSSFLLLCLIGFENLPRLLGDQSPGMISFFRIYKCSMWDDIVKMENQIPLSVLKEVFEKVKEAFISVGDYRDFNLLLFQMVVPLTPFWLGDIDEAEARKHKLFHVEIAREPHLLGYMHAFASQFLHIHTSGEDNGAKLTLLQQCNNFLENLVLQVCLFFPPLPSVERRFLHGYSAVHLDRAGIKFKSFCKLSNNIRFDKHSGTLYLPEIFVVEMTTEIFLRNMVALEYNDATRLKSVTRYIGLMGCLIQSPDDVRLLINRHVILPSSTFPLTDECTVKMWNDVRQPFIRSPLVDIPDDLSAALCEVLDKNYSKSKMKRTLSGLWDYVSSWKFWAPVGVFLGLAMTAIQTYCSVYQLASSGNTSGHAA